jgi:hypothetical protein
VNYDVHFNILVFARRAVGCGCREGEVRWRESKRGCQQARREVTLDCAALLIGNHGARLEGYDKLQCFWWFSIFGTGTAQPDWKTEETLSTSQLGQNSFLGSKVSRPAVGPAQPLFQRINGPVSLGIERPEHQVDFWPPSSAEIKNKWRYVCIPSNAFMACVGATLLPRNSCDSPSKTDLSVTVPELDANVSTTDSVSCLRGVSQEEKPFFHAWT